MNPHVLRVLERREVQLSFVIPTRLPHDDMTNGRGARAHRHARLAEAGGRDGAGVGRGCGRGFGGASPLARTSSLRRVVRVPRFVFLILPRVSRFERQLGQVFDVFAPASAAATAWQRGPAFARRSRAASAATPLRGRAASPRAWAAASPCRSAARNNCGSRPGRRMETGLAAAAAVD